MVLERVTVDGIVPYPVAAGRYHLYVSLACPGPVRTLIVRNWNGLQDAISVTVVDPVRDDRGLAFRDGPGHSQIRLNGFTFLSEAYAATDRNFDGRVTVRALGQANPCRIVNNSEDDICRMFNDAFNGYGNRAVNLFPQDLEAEHAELEAPHRGEQRSLPSGLCDEPATLRKGVPRALCRAGRIGGDWPRDDSFRTKYRRADIGGFSGRWFG